MPFHDGAGDAAVEIDIAAHQLALGPRQGARTAGEEPARQRVVGGVGNGERFVEVADFDHGEDRAENFFAGKRRVGFHVRENGRRDKITAARCDCGRERALPRERRLAGALGNEAQDFFAGLGVDHGADDRAGQGGIADRGGRGGGDQAGDEGVVDVGEHDEPGQRGAFLAGETEGAREGGGDGFVEVRIAVDDERVFAAHFADDFFQVGLAGERAAGGFPDLQADGARAGERDEVRVRMRDERGADFLAQAGEEVHDARGQAGGDENLHQPVRDDGRLLGGFHDDGVAGDDGRDDHAAEDREGEIPRGDDHAGAARRVTQHAAFAGHGLRDDRPVKLAGLRGVVAAEVDRFAHFAVGLEPGFAGLEDEEGVELGAARLHEVGGAFDDAGAVVGGLLGPGGLGAAGGGEGGLGVVGPAARLLADDFGGLGGVEGGEPLAGVAGGVVDEGGMAPSETMALGGERGAELVAGGGAGEVGVGGVAERCGGGRGRRRGEELDRVGEQLLLRGLAPVFDPEKTLVAGVFEEPADEVGHPGEQFADGAIFADPVAAGEERALQFVGHAVERLKLVGARIEAEAFGLGDGVGAAADVVRGERGGNDVDVFKEEERKFFVVGVALGFFRPDRYGPSALAGEDRLVVPIRAFHEADAERAGVRPRPRDQVAEIAFAIAEVSLQRDADGGLRAKLRFFEDGFEEREREVLQLVALHVEIDERADFGRAAENRPEARLQRGEGVFGVGRMDVGRERGDFDREVQARERQALRADVAEGDGGRLRERGGDGVEDVEIAVEKHVGLGLAHDGFAEEVDRGGEPELRVFAQLLHEVGGRLAGDKLRGHRDDVGLHRTGDEAGGKGRGGETGLQGGIQLHGFVAEVFLEVADDLGGGGEGGQHVDEAEELGLERGVLHRPFHHAGVGPFLGENAGYGRRLHSAEEDFAEFAHAALDGRVGGQKGVLGDHGSLTAFSPEPGRWQGSGPPGRPGQGATLLWHTPC